MIEFPLKDTSEVPLFDLGLTVAFGLLHLLLYVFYPKQRANLFYSIFVFGAAGRTWTADVLDISELPNQTAFLLSYLSLMSIGVAVFAFIAFLYAAFEERFRFHYWAIITIWTIGIVARLFFKENPTTLLISLSLLIILFLAVESLRVIGRALYKKQDGAWIVGLGVLFLIVSPLQIGFALLTNNGGMSHFRNVLGTQISLCGIIIANSLFLARTFARTNRNLEQQIVQVKELSASELEHVRTAADLRLQNEQERAKNALVEQELTLAANIQQGLFPESIPNLPGYDMAAFNRAARECGGDYYDVLPVEITDGKSNYLFCVADVSGKGLPASLLMSNMQATLRALAGRTESLRDLAARANELLHATSPSNKFVTAILVEIDPATGKGKYVNAGHNECFLLRGDGRETEILNSTGLPLGMFPGQEYDENSFSIERGDLLALFSDGVPEAQNSMEEEWGEPNLLLRIQEARAERAQTIIDIIAAEIDRFAGEAPQFDDITLLIVKHL